MQLDQIRQIAVIGLGRMGHGIAQTFALAGYMVRGFDASDEALSSAHRRIRRNLEDFVRNDLLDEDKIDAVLGRIVIADTEAKAAATAD